MALARGDSKLGKTSTYGMYIRSDAMDDFMGSFLPSLFLPFNSLRIDRFCVVDEGRVVALAGDDSKLGKTSMYIRSDAMDDFMGSFLPSLFLLINSLPMDRYCVVDEGRVVALARDDSKYVPKV